MYPSIDDSITLAKGVSQLFDSVFVFVDALDECPENDREELLYIIKSLESFIRLFIASRVSIDLSKELGNLSRVDIIANQSDIKLCLEDRVAKHHRLCNFTTQTPSLKHEIIQTIQQKAAGMFLLAHLQMCLLESQISERNIRKALITLPQGVFAFYDQALKRISEQEDSNKDLANRALSFIFCAKRNLTMNKLIHALSVEPGDNDFSAENCTSVQILLGVCAGLVKFGESSGDVGLVHITFQEYFKSHTMALRGNAESKIAEVRLTYLSFDTFSEGACEDGESLEQRLRTYSFLDYAAHQYSGQNKKVLALLENGADIDAIDTIGGCTAFTIATWLGNDAMVQLLVEKGADFGWEVFARLLWARGAQVDALDRWGRTPLMWAVYGKQHATVEILLGHGADITLGTHEGYTSSHLAADNGDERMIDILLSQGVPVGSRAQNGWIAYDIANIMTFNGVMTRLAIAGAVKSEASELRAACNADEHQADEWYIDFGRDDIARTLGQRSQQASHDEGTLDVAI
ncbi:putative Fungal STAND N-terminal Goodbye domain-containing protein [Seiridium cardinale]